MGFRSAHLGDGTHNVSNCLILSRDLNNDCAECIEKLCFVQAFIENPAQKRFNAEEELVSVF
jgi:hypothetical protein